MNTMKIPWSGVYKISLPKNPDRRGDTFVFSKFLASPKSLKENSASPKIPEQDIRLS